MASVLCSSSATRFLGMNVELFSFVVLGIVAWIVAVCLLVITYVKEYRDEFGCVEFTTRFVATLAVIVTPVVIFLK